MDEHETHSAPDGTDDLGRPTEEATVPARPTEDRRFEVMEAGVGVAFGVAIGTAVAGPIGAAVGGVVGAAAGFVAGEVAEHSDNRTGTRADVTEQDGTDPS
jgi:outer membrane lipoprotein SlyB